MSMRTTTGRLMVAVAALSALAACANVYLTAPPGAEIVLEANPEFVASHGGTSDVTAFVTEEIGTPVADGTVVFWSTNLGRIDRESRTRNGVARATFVSDSRSGTATVRAFSGGGTTGGGGGGASTTTTTTLSSSRTGGASAQPWYAAERTPAGGTYVASGGILGGGVAAASAVSVAARAEATIPIQVGNVRVTAIHLRADPPRITTSNSTHVFAVVVDNAGNPVENVPVYFEVVPGTSVSQEFFDFTGPVFTNNNGEAENVLRTRRTTAGNVQVRARAAAAGGFKTSDPLTISIL
jgi:hypothetical protein